MSLNRFVPPSSCNLQTITTMIKCLSPSPWASSPFSLDHAEPKRSTSQSTIDIVFLSDFVSLCPECALCSEANPIILFLKWPVQNLWLVHMEILEMFRSWRSGWKWQTQRVPTAHEEPIEVYDTAQRYRHHWHHHCQQVEWCKVYDVDYIEKDASASSAALSCSFHLFPAFGVVQPTVLEFHCWPGRHW